MICCFPDFYPDEIFYSACARYSDRMQYPSKRAGVKQLFGRTTTTAVVDLPSNLNHFVRSLAPGQQITVDQIIDRHTLLPFYGPFLPPERVLRLREDMAGDAGSTIHIRSGIVAGRISLLNHLRFCPVCAVEDRQNFGEAFWHRLHQSPGVEVCPIHRVFLEQSNARIHNVSMRYEFISAERAVQPIMPRILQSSNHGHNILVDIARNAQWLLDEMRASPGHIALSRRYHHLLGDQGFITLNGRVRKNTLFKSFKEHCPSDLLINLQCELLEEIEQTWLTRLLGAPDGVLPPICHLLLMQFLGCTTETFFDISPEPHTSIPFGKGPWPCLNPVCIYFQLPHIGIDQITYSHRSRGRVAGLFTCFYCGFSYSRIGPDTSNTKCQQIGQVRTYGPLWESTLRELWLDPSIGRAHIAEQLGVSKATINNQARRLGLVKGSEKNDHPAAMAHVEDKQVEIEEKRNAYRAKWLKGMEQNPDAGMTILINKFYIAYKWLRRYDHDWLRLHTPPPQKRKQPPARIDWSSRDESLVEKVVTSATQLKDNQERPKRITIAAIGRDINKLVMLQKDLDKLPKTAQALAELVETYEDVAVRRVFWAAEQYCKEQKYPTRKQLMRRAEVRHILDAPVVQDAVDSALRMLEKTAAC